MFQELATITPTETEGFQENTESPQLFTDNYHQQFPELHEASNKNEIMNEEEQPNQEESKPKFLMHQKVGLIIFNIYLQTFAQKLYLFSLILVVILSFMLQGQQQGVYNTMVKHLPYIYGWQENEDDDEGADRTDFYLGLINSVVNIGAVIVQIILFFFQNAIGRKDFMKIASLMTIVGSSLGLIQSTTMLVIGRILNGCSIGIATTLTVMYIVEFVPFELRPQMSQLGIIFLRVGLVLQYGLGYGLPDDYQNTTNSYWRFMVAVPIILAVFHQILLNFVIKQDTPTYIYTTTKENKEKKTLDVLRKLYPEERAQKELQTLINIIGNSEKQQEKVTLTILLKNYKIRLLNGFCMAASFHFGLTYPILMFSNKILETHQSKSTATFITTLTPVMDFLALLPAMFLVKRFGIKRLYCISASGVIFSALLFAILGLSCSFGIPAALFSYSAEILPFIGNTINTSFMYTFGFLIMQFYLPVSNALGGHEGSFILFACGLFIILMIAGPCGLMINTQGLTKEEINERFDNFRWFYRSKIEKQNQPQIMEI